MLECQAADLPEPCCDRLLLCFGEVAPVAGHLDRVLDVLVDELPAHAVEAWDVVAVDDVDALGSVLADQCGPFVGALPAANDQDTRSRELVEAHQVTRVRSPLVRDGRGPVGKVRVVANPGSAHDRVGDD